MTLYSLMDGVSGRPGPGSSGTQPPAAGTAYSGPYIAGLAFQVTQGGMWLQGYRWYVAASAQDTGALKFALRNIYASEPNAAVVPAGTVTAPGSFTAGQFNTVMLATPLLLSPGWPYLAAAGGTFSTGFPLTQNQFGSTEPYAAGITSGPLMAYPSLAAASGTWPQQPFTTSASDPTLLPPSVNDLNDLLWLDVLVSDQPPAGTLSWSAWPNLPMPEVATFNDQTGYTLGFEFSLTQACTLGKIKHFSPSQSTVLPSRCLIWDVASQTAVPGTDNTTPAWLDLGTGAPASPGDGWIYCDYSASGVTLPAGTSFKASTFAAAGSNWFGATADVFGAGDTLPNGFTAGPLVIPGNAAASPGQQSWHTAAFGYPATSTNPEVDWIDVEVTPAPVPQQPPQQFLYMMRRFP